MFIYIMLIIHLGVKCFLIYLGKKLIIDLIKKKKITIKSYELIIEFYNVFNC